MDTTNYTSEEPTVELRVLHIILALIGLFDQLFMVNIFFNEAKYRISWKYLMASKAIAGAIYCIAHIILQILNLYGMIPMKYCVIVKLCETISLTYSQLFFVTLMFRILLNEKSHRKLFSFLLIVFSIIFATLVAFYQDFCYRHFILICSFFGDRNAWDPVVNQLAILLPDLLVCIAFLSWSWYESIPQPTGHLQHGFIAKKRESTVSWWLVVFNLALHMVFNIPKMGMVTRIIFKDEKKVSESEYYIWNLSTILYQVISPWLWIWTFRKFGKMYNKMNLSGTHLDSPWFRTEEDNRIAENTRDERARHMEDQKKEKKNNSRKKCSICCWSKQKTTPVRSFTQETKYERFKRIFGKPERYV
ncbi:Protein CBG26216 [Caenorhabditis briggsae]|uniref:Protein CBG26216 n=1 Tax=Caenorhabditis briggsae TaxID=6238 RepID=B6IEM4_CAEBR|nr:Protein CBG26216 [Caenorhabditis briggsae]CAR98354.1 Protein CBG26216 [Caenorhabditis briggsae]